MPQPDLLLITGIPGTGKTTYGDKFAQDFGFAHYDFEEPNTVNRCASNPQRFIEDIWRTGSSIVITWGFAPDHEYSLDILSRLRHAGFKLIWSTATALPLCGTFRDAGQFRRSCSICKCSESRIPKSLHS